MVLPVISVTARVSSADAAAAARSPVNSCTTQRVLRARGSELSAPVVRTTSRCLRLRTSQRASSHSDAAVAAASQLKRRASATVSVPDGERLHRAMRPREPTARTRR